MTGVVTSNPPQDPLIKSENNDLKTEENIPIAPSATPAASRGTEQPRPGATVCQNCLTTTTPLWRRDENGQILCNACGLFFKLHGRRRPISLKTDVIKSRNRSRNTSLSRRPQTKRARNSPRPEDEKQRSVSTDRFGQTSAQASNPSPNQVPVQALGQASSQTPNQVPLVARPPVGTTNAAVASPLPVQPSPSSNVNSPRVQPSPMGFVPFEQPTPVRTPTNSFPLPPIASAASTRSPEPSTNLGPPNIQLMRGSMSELLLPRSPPEGLERVPPLHHISASDLHEQQRLPTMRTPSQTNSPKSAEDLNKELSTRVSELELVNDLLKRRIADLEFSENQARRTALDAQQTAENLWKQMTLLKESRPHA